MPTTEETPSMASTPDAATLPQALSQTSSTALLMMIAPFFLWGTAMVAMKGTIDHTTPMFMASLRLLPAGVLVLIASVVMGRSQPKGWSAWLWICLFGVVDGAMFQGFLAEGLVRTGAGLGSVMIDSQPLAVALMARILFGERIGLFGVVGLAFGAIGISLLGLPDEWILHGIDAIRYGDLSHLSWQSGVVSVETVIERLFQSGEWLMLLAALSMAVGTVMVRYVSRHADPVSATAWHMVMGGIILTIISGVNETEQWQHLTTSDWMALSYASVFGSALAYGLFFYFASQKNLTSFIALTFLTPVFALLFSNIFLSEQLTTVQWAGVGFTLVSIYLINQRELLMAKLQQIRAGRSSDVQKTAAGDVPLQ
ncbi:MAG: DMT family transporter [Leptolyngbyaceae bacterium]|nr:DMT family transporter [Leptolyngbyaceae bacterium]